MSLACVVLIMTDYKITLPCGTVIEGPSVARVLQVAQVFDERFKYDDELHQYELEKRLREEQRDSGRVGSAENPL